MWSGLRGRGERTCLNLKRRLLLSPSSIWKSGFLSGKHQREAGPEPGSRFTLGASGDLYRRRYWQDAQFEAVDRFKAFFEKRGKPLVQVAVAWVLAQPAITSAIIGATKPEQLAGSLPAADMQLDAEEMAFLDSLWYDLPRTPEPG